MGTSCGRHPAALNVDGRGTSGTSQVSGRHSSTSGGGGKTNKLGKGPPTLYGSRVYIRLLPAQVQGDAEITAAHREIIHLQVRNSDTQ